MSSSEGISTNVSIRIYKKLKCEKINNMIINQHFKNGDKIKRTRSRRRATCWTTAESMDISNIRECLSFNGLLIIVTRYYHKFNSCNHKVVIKM
jgi:hypothetical protein